MQLICDHMDNKSPLEKESLVSSSIQDYDQKVISISSKQVGKVFKLGNKSNIDFESGANIPGEDITNKQLTTSEAQIKSERKL